MSTIPALCIVNPAAGRRHASEDDLARALEIIRESGFDLRVVETGVPEPSPRELAERALGEGARAVIVAGGDGTVAPAASALLGTKVTLGLLPYGSFMNIAKSIAIPLDCVEAARVVARRNVVRIDVGEVHGRHFFEAAGVGVDADAFGAARAVERGRWSQALRRLRDLLTRRTRAVTIEVDGREAGRHRVLQVLVMNGPYYLWSFPVAEADLTDGMLDVAVFPRMGRLELVRHLLAVWRREPPARRPVLYRGREVRLASSGPVPVHADGAVAGTLPATFRALRGALSVFAPN